MSGQDRSFTGHLSRAAMSVAEPFYCLGVNFRNAMFDTGLRKSRRLPRPVISVGNVTTGGTGKTPMVMEIVDRLIRRGQHPAVLTRGYGADESRELVAALESRKIEVPVGVGADRFLSATRLLDKTPALSVFVLDDGFQHRQLHRDLDLILIDATEPFGYEHILPRGMLRESTAFMRRADGVILTRTDQAGGDEIQDLDQMIEKITSRSPIAHSQFIWKQLCAADDSSCPLTKISNRKVMGVCGVGNPAAFEKMLCQHAGPGTDVTAFADHYAYDAATVNALLNRAETEGYQCVVTTQKDWVKWKPLIDSQDTKLTIYRAVLGIEFNQGDQALDELLDSVLAPTSAEKTTS